jgi:3-hydroxymyristoyl/3-hydroxydecanoyl-(acyl carrier protein) dehydratase
VYPGDQLRLEAEILATKMRITRCHATASVDGHLCAEADLLSALMDRP